jgi:hypothetical protein
MLITFLAVNLCVSAYLVLVIVRALGYVPMGEVIRPMGLFTHVLGVSILAFVTSAGFGMMYPLTGPKSLASFGWGLSMGLSGLIPCCVSMVAIRMLIGMRSLVLAD